MVITSAEKSSVGWYSKAEISSLKQALADLSSACRTYLRVLHLACATSGGRLALPELWAASTCLRAVVAASDSFIDAVADAGMISMGSATAIRLWIPRMSLIEAILIQEIFRHFVHKDHRATEFPKEEAYVTAGFRDQLEGILKELQAWEARLEAGVEDSPSSG